MGRFRKKTSFGLQVAFSAGIVITSLVLAVPSADATSLGRGSARKNSVCGVAARFLEAKPKQGKVVWIFDRIGPSTPLPAACRGLTSSFEVWIWSGSFSSLSNSLVYPLSITEPKPGAEFDLRLEFVKVREVPTAAHPKETAVSGWFLSSDSDAMKVRIR